MYTTDILNTLLLKKDLSQKEAETLLTQIMDGSITPVQTAAILTALRMKGESVDEITGFILAMRKNMTPIKTRQRVIDVCGTGGDNAGTFNISTTVAFVVAGCGVPVVKHGNRAASSLSGSADVLKALGIYIELTPQQAEKVLQNVGMVFLFAPIFHPSMKQVAMVRNELKIRTVFNFLGPFANPAAVKRQLIGVPSIAIAKKLAMVATKLGYTHLMLVTSDDGLDEVSLSGKTSVFEIKGKKIKKYRITPEKLGFKSSKKNSLAGGSVEQNAVITKKILAGEKGSKRDIVVLNSACALLVAGKVRNIREGIHLASKAIDRGAAQHILENLIKETQKYV